MKQNFKKGIAFRIIVPIIAVTGIIGLIFYMLLLKTILDFAHRQISIGLEEISRDIYEIYDNALRDLALKGLMNDDRAVRIEKARTIGRIEEFMRGNNLRGVIYEQGEKSNGVPLERLNIKADALELQKLHESIRNLEERKVSRLSFRGNDYYVFPMNLDLWKWHLIILKDASEYSSLLARVWLLYIITAIILLSSALFLMVYLRKVIHEPLNHIISSIKRGERPEYMGIEEFEFLSKNIKAMMDSLERETRLLNYVYYIAATKRGDDFFEEVVRAINHLFDINSLIAKISDDGKTGHILGLYINGEVRKGFSSPLIRTPCQDVLEKRHLVVIERDVLGLYPSSELLRESGAESYIGFTIFDRKGQPIGILNGFGKAREYSESDIKVLQTLGQVVATEIERIDEEEEKERIRVQLFHAQKMEAIGTLAGGIAHDFNNMLQGILGYASLLKLKIPETDPIYKPLDVIERTAERAAELTQQLLGFARKGKFFVEILNINDLVSEAIKIISRTFDRAIKIKTDLSDNIWRFEGDKGQMVGVILNLCVNARDAMPVGGTLTISTYNREIKEGEMPYSWARPGSYVVISVEDTGGGMDKETMKHIFEPFFTTKEIGKGTGMGLAMVYGVVKNHGGFITVDSEIGKGSTFTIYLPRTEAEIKKEVGQTRTPISGSGTILIVDDEESIRNLLKDALSGLGYSVKEASNGKEAIEIFNLNKDRIDLIILDLIMPEMGGEETLLGLRELKPDVKVIIATGFGVTESLQHTLRQKGVSGFINKPFNIAEISEAIKTALRV